MKYFAEVKRTGKTPFPGYAVGGRGYPDIALAGNKYLTILPVPGRFLGVLGATSGTSASAPAMAAMISNINAARLALGKGSVGWLNPALYALSASFVNDITVGHNRFPNGGPMCPHGYHTAKGWDPVTGLGSVDYAKLEKTFVALGRVNYASGEPSASPTNSPTMPTMTPTVVYKKTKKPTQKPTRKPTKAPRRSVLSMGQVKSKASLVIESASPLV